MAWTNGPLILYHGTTERSAKAIQANGVDLGFCASATEFGKGFYTTPNLPQAIRHAKRIYREGIASASRGGPDPWSPAVLRFEVKRVDLAPLTALWFTTPTADWMDFVDHCSNGLSHMGLAGSGFYDVVSGPIRNKKLVVEDRPFEQVSFHTAKSIALLINPIMTSIRP